MAVVPTTIGSYIQPRATAPRPRPRPVNPLGGILSNPAVVQAQLGQNQANTAANALLRQQRSQALIGFGSPGLASQYGSAVDPNTAAAAGANQYSILANLHDKATIAHRQLLNSLAGHGLVHSGETGYQEGRQARSLGQAQYDATNNLLAQLSGYGDQYLNTTQQGRNNYLNALLSAFGQYGANPLG